jgi:flagellar basal body L-ring protein FlgH
MKKMLPVFIIFILLSCTWFQTESTPTPPLSTLTPSATVKVLPTPGLYIQSDLNSVRVGELIEITVQIENVLDASCNALFYRDGSMLTFGWLGESNTQLVELVSAIHPTNNLSFTLKGKFPGTAEVKTSCSGNVIFHNGKEDILNGWYGVSEPILITVH